MLSYVELIHEPEIDKFVGLIPTFDTESSSSLSLPNSDSDYVPSPDSNDDEEDTEKESIFQELNATIWEVNQACLALAKNPEVPKRTRIFK